MGWRGRGSSAGARGPGGKVKDQVSIRLDSYRWWVCDFREAWRSLGLPWYSFIHSFRKCFRSPYFVLLCFAVGPPWLQAKGAPSTCSHFPAAFHQALCFQVAPCLNMGITFSFVEKTASFGCKIVIIPNDFHKEPAYLCRRRKRCGFDSWVGKIPWRRAWQPTGVFLLESPMDGEAWQATVHRVAQSQTRLKRVSTHTHALYEEVF